MATPYRRPVEMTYEDLGLYRPRRVFIVRGEYLLDPAISATIFDDATDEASVKAVFWNAYLTWQRAKNGELDG